MSNGKRRLWFLGFSFVAGMVLFFSRYFIEADNPKLRLATYDLVFDGRPATGLVFSFYLNYRPKQFLLLWGGKRIWKEFIWYDNGQLMAERPYKNGLPDGNWKMWHENGNVKSLKHYVAGQIDGDAWVWHANGQLASFDRYAGDRELTHKSWISDGTPYYNYVYQNGQKVGIKGGDFCKRVEKTVN